MLKSGLGEALDSSITGAARVLDLFTGSAAVAWHVGQKYDVPVIASDLQLYSTVLAASVITRTRPLEDDRWIDDWFERARGRLSGKRRFIYAENLQTQLKELPVQFAAQTARSLCEKAFGWPITLRYGGYYFSPLQALWIDALRISLPLDPEYRNVALASLIQAASRATASPGHTAQPFKANETAGRFLIEAWRRDLITTVKTSAADIALKFSRKLGEAVCGDALEVAERARPGDIAFLDPPYSGVHYSRFYHVLETIARGEASAAEGTGRYPPPEERPNSDFSVGRRSAAAFDRLLNILAQRGASAIITFPAGTASNGLSGERVKEIAEQHYKIESEKISSRFSTLGGNLKTRIARHDTHELILKLSLP